MLIFLEIQAAASLSLASENCACRSEVTGASTSLSSQLQEQPANLFGLFHRWWGEVGKNAVSRCQGLSRSSLRPFWGMSSPQWSGYKSRVQWLAENSQNLSDLFEGEAACELNCSTSDFPFLRLNSDVTCLQEEPYLGAFLVHSYLFHCFRSWGNTMKISFVTESDCWLIFMFSFQLRRSLYRAGTKLIVPLKNFFLVECDSVSFHVKIL